MTQAERFVRRNRVNERNAAAIGLASGLVALLAGAEPTGSTVIDWLLVVLAVGVVVWASASAPWWAPAGAAGIAAVIAFQPVLAIIAAVAFVAGLWIGVRRTGPGRTASGRRRCGAQRADPIGTRRLLRAVGDHRRLDWCCAVRRRRRCDGHRLFGAPLGSQRRASPAWSCSGCSVWLSPAPRRDPTCRRAPVKPVRRSPR